MFFFFRSVELSITDMGQALNKKKGGRMTWMLSWQLQFQAMRNLSVNHIMAAGRQLQKGQQTTIQAGLMKECFCFSSG